MASPSFVGPMLAFQALLLTVIILWRNKVRREQTAQLQAKLEACAAAGEKTLIGPTIGKLRRGYLTMRVTAVLTDKRIIFMPSSRGEVLLSTVTRVQEMSEFNGEWFSGALFCVITRAEGEMGLLFLPHDAQNWKAQIEAHITPQAMRVAS